MSRNVDEDPGGSSVSPPSVPENLGQSHPLLEAEVPTMQSLDDVVMVLRDQAKKVKELQHTTAVLQDDSSLLCLDMALTMAGQLVSRMLGHSSTSVYSTHWRNAIQGQRKSGHWGKNLVEFMKKNFSSDYATQLGYADVWDKVIKTRNSVSHLQMLEDYDENKAVKLIAILERSPAPDLKDISYGILQILKNRKAFLESDPYKDKRSRR